jgi:hypothetical protein
VHGDCHFLRCGPHLGSIEEQKETRKGESERQKKSYTTEQTFRSIEPNFRHYVRLADQQLGKIFRAEAWKTKLELQAERTDAQ